MKYCSVLCFTVFLLFGCSGSDGPGAGSGSTNTSASGSGTGGTSGTVTPSSPGFQFDTGIGGSGGVIGNIDAFGSIFINGLELATDDAEFYLEGTGGFSQNDLREGHYVVVTGDVAELNADEVFYRANLKGPVSAAPVAIDASAGRYELRVLGQTVMTSSSTRVEGVLAANIVAGDLLEVSGPIDGDGRVLATFVERKSTLTTYKAIGIVDNLNTTDRTLELGGLLVDYAGAAFSEFAEVDLMDGQLVEVTLPPANFTPPASATATTIERLPVPMLQEGAEVEVGGFIDSFDSPAAFTVSSVPVTTDQDTSFEDGGAGELGLNAKVEVSGRVNASGVVVAEEIHFKSSPAAVRVEGEVVSVVTSDGVTGTVNTALGVTFEVRASSELEELSSLNDLAPGDYIEARGFLSGSAVVTVEMEREGSGNSALLRGPLTGFSELNGTVEILGNTVLEPTNPNAFTDAEGSAVSRAEFYALLATGASVQARWSNFGSLADPATELSLRQNSH